MYTNKMLIQNYYGILKFQFVPKNINITNAKNLMLTIMPNMGYKSHKMFSLITFHMTEHQLSMTL